jgi:hypothetical protein
MTDPRADLQVDGGGRERLRCPTDGIRGASVRESVVFSGSIVKLIEGGCNGVASTLWRAGAVAVGPRNSVRAEGPQRVSFLPSTYTRSFAKRQATFVYRAVAWRHHLFHSEESKRQLVEISETFSMRELGMCTWCYMRNPVKTKRITRRADLTGRRTISA